MNPGPQFKRRGFIGAALVACGAVGGWLTRRGQNTPPQRTAPPTTSDSRFVYDVSEFEKTDPALLRYRPATQWPTGFQRVKTLSVFHGIGIFVAGDRSVKHFTSEGALRNEFQLDRPPHCIALDRDRLFIGRGNTIEVFDLAGKSLLRTPRLGENSFLTALAVHGDRLYVADAGQREVLVLDSYSGKVIDRFGNKDSARQNPGFNIPSPYFDLSLASDNRLRIVNPGRLRVETYSLDGKFQSSWGEPGMRIDRFCGCCNPVYFTLTPEGDFITSEKGLARINIYSPDGTFQGAVAGPELLAPDKESVRTGDAESRSGLGFDVACDERGRVFVLDPYRKSVRIFEPLSPSEAA